MESSTYCSNAGSDSLGNLWPTEALCSQCGDCITVENCARPADRLACLGTVLPCPLLSGSDSVRNPDPVLFAIQAATAIRSSPAGPVVRKCGSVTVV